MNWNSGEQANLQEPFSSRLIAGESLFIFIENTIENTNLNFCHWSSLGSAASKGHAGQYDIMMMASRCYTALPHALCHFPFLFIFYIRSYKADKHQRTCHSAEFL